jgi:16S rRNA (guanine527-N7)-methyltransferase
MDAARISELLQPFVAVRSLRDETEGSSSSSLTESQLRSISIYVNMLTRWNARINLTAVRDPEQIVRRHFGESLFAARRLPGALHDLIDLGSGAGFPGLPIKIWAPRIRLTLIESSQKKAAFLREVARALTLTDINVFAGRAESFTGQAGIVTLRAVERFEAALPTAARLLAPQGRLALLIGQSQVPVAMRLLPGLSWREPIPLPLSQTRVLLVGSKS